MANVNVHLPPGPGLVSNSGLRMGVWVFPDCRSAGTLEDLLKTAGQEVYPKLMDNAGRFIGELGDLRDLGLNSGERREFNKPAGKDKALLAVVANVLRPGRAVHNSIQDNRWISSQSINGIPTLTALQTFVESLVG